MANNINDSSGSNAINVTIADDNDSATTRTSL
jgi:hypothetical protein